jgi:hypothetical protein
MKWLVLVHACCLGSSVITILKCMIVLMSHIFAMLIFSQQFGVSL